MKRTDTDSAASDARDLARRYAKSLTLSFSTTRDPDGAPVKEDDLYLFITGNGIAGDSNASMQDLRNACWQQYHRSPFVKTAVNDSAGYLAGDGFEISSPIMDVDNILKKMNEDFRNRLNTRWKQYLRHKSVDGEHYLQLTCHDDKEPFIEVDFVDPSSIEGQANETDDGIIFHPSKTLMPLIYTIKTKDGSIQIPSINIAYLPSLIDIAKKENGYSDEKLSSSRATKKAFKKVGGFNKFIIAWDGSLLTRRNSSYLRTVIIWSNLYTLLKMVEIDHKRALASFAWVMQPKDNEAWELWMSLTDDEKKKTGLLGPKPPGSTLIPPPGFEIKAITPNLPKIDGQDTDILEHMVAGLNLPTDVVTGTSKGTFASVKESRGPWGDRITDQQDDFRKYLVYEYGQAVLFLHRTLYGLAPVFKAKKAVGFGKDKNPVFKNIPLGIDELITVSMPLFGSGDFEGTVKANCGAKHTGLNQALGISKEAIARKLGFANYSKQRLKSATEDAMYPELIQIADSMPHPNAASDQAVKVNPND